jgi:hypothetical protein
MTASTSPRGAALFVFTYFVALLALVAGVTWGF